MEPTGPAMELRSIDPTRRRSRRYHMAECRTLFGERALLITWGRIGAPPRVRFETFASSAKLVERREELLARRNAHGYEVTSRV
jgi:predicted DNA-binding WGR domain protein